MLLSMLLLLIENIPKESTLNVKVPFLVLVLSLHSADFTGTFKPFEFTTNILMKGPHSSTKMSRMSLIFNL